MVLRVARRLLAAAIFAVACPPAMAAEFRSVADAAVVLYDAPSLKAKPLYILGRDTPLEVLVPVEGWVKVRDADGTFGWVERKGLADKRMLIVRPPFAEVRASADEKAALVFRAEPGVLLELGEAVTSAAAASAPGWVKVRHADGQSGFVRITQVFGI
jgi:SH3-like domain-containing protein